MSKNGKKPPQLDRSSDLYDPFVDPDVTVIRHTPGGDTYFVKHKGKRIGSLCWRRVRKRYPGRERCTRPAGWGTNHVGTGACRFHGGASERGIKRIAGTDYGQYLVDEYAGRYGAFMTMEEPRGLMSELSLLRVLMTALVDRPDLDTKEIRDTAESIGRMIDRMERIDTNAAVTQAQIQLLVVHMVGLINRFIEDKDQRLEFVTEFLRTFGLQPTEEGQLGPGSVSDGRVIELAETHYGMKVT